jgi:hypothetical protein
MNKCSAVQSVRRESAQKPPTGQTPLADPDSLRQHRPNTFICKRAERCQNSITSIEHFFHHGDDLGVSLSSGDRTPLTSLFFFQNFNPRSRLRERDSLRPPPRRSSLRGDGLLALSLSPLVMRDTGSGDVSPRCDCLLPGIGGTGGAAGSPSCAEARCVASALFGQLPGAANGSSVVARLSWRCCMSSSVGASEEG